MDMYLYRMVKPVMMFLLTIGLLFFTAKAQDDCPNDDAPCDCQEDLDCVDGYVNI